MRFFGAREMKREGMKVFNYSVREIGRLGKKSGSEGPFVGVFIAYSMLLSHNATKEICALEGAMSTG